MFNYKKDLNANGGRVLVKFTLKDSETFSIGDSVALASGVLALSSNNTLVMGIIAALMKADGTPLTDNGAGGEFSNTYTTGSSNTVCAMVDVSTTSIYSVPCDAALGTTTGSNLAGYNMDVLAASDTLDESTALTTTAQFFSFGPDPDTKAPSNSVLVTIQESQFKI